MYLLQMLENKLILVSPGILLLALKTSVVHSPLSWQLQYWASTSVPVLCQHSSQNWKCFWHGILSRAHIPGHKNSIILPYCMYVSNLKIDNIPDSLGALWVSRQQTPVPSRLLCLLEHWHLSTVQPDCCTMPELPAQAKLKCSSVFLSKLFLQHHYSSVFLEELARILTELPQWYRYLPLWPALGQKKTCCFLHIHMKTMQFAQCSLQTAPNTIFASGLQSLYLKKQGNIHVDQTSQISNHSQDSRERSSTTKQEDIPLRKVSWSGMKKAPEHIAARTISLISQNLYERKTNKKTKWL